MSEKLEQLAQKVDLVLSRLEQVQAENRTLKLEKDNLKKELLQLRKEHEALLVQQNDRSEKVRSRLTVILDRLDQLETLSA
jgi:regulator of replication initiation timing